MNNHPLNEFGRKEKEIRDKSSTQQEYDLLMEKYVDSVRDDLYSKHPELMGYVEHMFGALIEKIEDESPIGMFKKMLKTAILQKEKDSATKH